MIKTNVKNLGAVKNAIRKEIEKYRDAPFVTVGIRSSAGKHADSDLTIAQVGAYNEFGTETIPERSFLRAGVRNAEEELIKIIRIRMPKDGIEKAMNLVGLAAQNAVQKQITELRTPPNAESTSKAKNSSNPLIDTGQLRQSITFEVSNEKPEEGI